MGIGTKTCKNCSKIVASAKKVCDCGHVFLEKKKRGFREIPVVITSDRLRSSRGPDDDESDGRPVRTKKHKYQGSDFIYSAASSSSTSSKPLTSEFGEPPSMFQPSVSSALETKTLIYKSSEKLYPKRDRTKTSKFEEFFSNNLKKGEGKSKPSDENIEINNTNFPMDGDVIKLETTGNVHENQPQNEETEDKTYLGDNKFEMIEPRKNIVKNTSNKIEDGNNERDEILELSDELLLQNIDACMQIIKEESKLIPPPTLLPISQDFSTSESDESIVEDDVCLTRIKIPKRIRKIINKCDTNSRDDDDVPLSYLMKSGISGATIKNGKLKRPRGRPRKYPIVINKIKRPVGRPKKEKSESNNGRKALPNIPPKKKRGRPANAVPALYGLYSDPYAALFDDEDDDVRDPDYKSPSKSLMSPTENRTLERSGRRCFLSPNNMMSERMYQELYRMEAEDDDQPWVDAQQSKVPAEKKELYSHILKEINRRILSQAFFVSLG